MTWKAIGQSVIGTSHTATGRSCEDAVQYAILHDTNNEEILVCCVSDGAGSAAHAAYAAAFTTGKVVAFATQLIAQKEQLTEGHIYTLAEEIYDALAHEAAAQNTELNEYSCTLLGCIIMPDRAAFFQIGDGAIVRNDGSNFYTTIWWPHNGEYQNTTSFLIDDRSFGNLEVTIIEDRVTEVALFSDGLQLLALNTESRTVHQPFFTGLFRHLRRADDSEKTDLLNRKLADYLGSAQINDRTDDDKTLFLATRLLP